MIHIHPFPARMAPEIVLNGLESLPKNYVVLDPMSGSGMVLGTAAKLGLSAVGYDIDPLACLISKVNGTKINESRVKDALNLLIKKCTEKKYTNINLPWVDDDTEKYMDFWFAPKQKYQLSVLSYFLIVKPLFTNPKIIDLLKVIISRLIITKEPTASRARDTAHSRPHRTIVDNEFDIFLALPKSLKHVLRALNSDELKTNVKMYKGDARKIGRIKDSSIDCIVTSPPYLNAIDYIRGHRLSLVWLGYSLSNLRKIRSRSVGTEVSENRSADENLQKFLNDLHADIDDKKKNIIKRYYADLRQITDEAYRVLRTDREVTYVVGNSRIKGHEIRNSDLLISAAQQSGFRFMDQKIREIPENRRYMPLINASTSILSKRIRSEHILVFRKSF